MGNELDHGIQTGMSTKTYSPIVELRQYTLHPGKRDDLIELFDREFVETQEAVGIQVIGQFRDLDDPDRFVWLRGFNDMSARAQSLNAFYGGPVWKAHRAAANATMIDSDNVLLLRPVHTTSGFSLKNGEPRASGSNTIPKGLVSATIHYFDTEVDPDFISYFENKIKPTLTDAGALILAYFVTEDSTNNFPALPVRESENVFVWFAGFPDQATYEHHIAALAKSKLWNEEISKSLTRRQTRGPDRLRLSPTTRSRVRG
jgi:quinol monooxygenase YgiN